MLPRYSNCVLDHRYWNGDFRDHSGNNNSGTPTGCSFQKKPDKHVVFEGTDLITVADSPELQLTEGTIICYGDFDSSKFVDDDRVVDKADGGGENYIYYFRSATSMRINNGSVTSTATVNWDGAKSVAVSFATGSKPKFYANGAFANNGGTALTFTVDDAPLLIGNNGGSSRVATSPYKGVLIYNTVLTDEEISQAHAWIMSTRTVKYPKKNLVYPSQIPQGKDTKYGVQVLSNNEFDLWANPTYPDDWVVSGSQDANNYIEEGSGGGCRIVSDGTAIGIGQTVLTIGKKYRLKYTVDAVVTGSGKFVYGGETSFSSAGTYELEFTASATTFQIFRYAGSPSDFTLGSVSVQEVKETVASYDMKNVHGKIIDKTGNGNDGTIIGAIQTKALGGLNALTFNGDTSSIDLGSDFVDVGADSVSFLVKMNSSGGAGAGSIISNGKFIVFGTANSIAFTSDAGGSFIEVPAGDIIYGEWNHVVCTSDAAGAGVIYINGNPADAGATGTPASGLSNVFLGNRSAGDRGWDGDIAEVEFFNYQMTQAEVSADYEKYAKIPYFLDNLKDANESIAAEGGVVGEYLSNTDWRFGDTSARYKISRDSIDGMVGGDELLGGMTYTNWTADNDGVLSNPSSDILRITHGGTNSPGAYQEIATAGRTYKITGIARSGGTSLPRIQGYGIVWEGTNSTADQPFDFIYTQTGNTRVWLGATLTSTGFVEYENVTVKEVDYNDKVIECTTAGMIYQEMTQAYGTWEFDWRKLDGSVVDMMFICDKPVLHPSANGYLFESSSASDNVSLYKLVGGSGSALMASAVQYVADSTWHRLRITRRYDGVFTVYIKGGIYTNWTTVVAAMGANPTAPQTDTTTSKYLTLDMDAGDKISNFRFMSGVVAP